MESKDCWISLMPKSCQTHLHGNGIKKSHQDQLHQNNQIKTKHYEGESKDRPSMLADFSPCVLPNLLLLQATKTTPPNAYDRPRDCPTMTPLRCFTHKVKRRVICVLALKIQSLTINKIISAMEERKKTISPLPIDQLPSPRVSE